MTKTSIPALEEGLYLTAAKGFAGVSRCFYLKSSASHFGIDTSLFAEAKGFAAWHLDAELGEKLEALYQEAFSWADKSLLPAGLIALEREDIDVVDVDGEMGRSTCFSSLWLSKASFYSFVKKAYLTDLKAKIDRVLECPVEAPILLGVFAPSLRKGEGYTALQNRAGSLIFRSKQEAQAAAKEVRSYNKMAKISGKVFVKTLSRAAVINGQGILGYEACQQVINTLNGQEG